MDVNTRGQISRWLIGLVGACALHAGTVLAADWPNYRGPNHDQTSSEKIKTDWGGGLKEVWRKPFGESLGTLSVVGDRAYYFAEKDRNEVLYALDSGTGAEVWKKDMGPTTSDRQGGPCPRSTPTVHDGKVYLLSTYLKLYCFDAKDGKEIWKHDLVKDFGGKVIKWENAASPVIDGDLLFVVSGAQGASLMAFDKNSGKLAWKSQDDQMTHASPTPATIHGERQIIFFTQKGLVSAAPTDGKILWRHPYPFRTSTAASPVVGGDKGDIVYCSAGYGVGGGAVQVSKDGAAWKVNQLWQTPNETMNHWMTPVHSGGHLYGLFGFRAQRSAPLKCIEIATGKELWAKPGYGHGGTILIDGHILVQGDQGQLVLAKMSPAGYEEVARMQPLNGKCWTMPVVANGKVYLHSDKEVVCLEIGK